MKKFIKDINPYLIIIISVILIRTFLVTPVTVDGPSMQKTLYTNDVLMLYKFNKNNIKRYDIVVLYHNNDHLIKRVIGLPNEKIKCVSGIIYINEEEMTNEYGYGKTEDFSEIKLSDNEYFVMGDNREDSLDSRYFGPITKNDILGNTNFIIFPFNRIGEIK